MDQAYATVNELNRAINIIEPAAKLFHYVHCKKKWVVLTYFAYLIFVLFHIIIIGEFHLQTVLLGYDSY